MNKQATVFRKITNLEQELQKLKLEAYLSLPKKIRTQSLYSEKSVLNAARETRKKIWQKRYAKKI